jgi:retron-type reverse transcriptase
LERIRWHVVNHKYANSFSYRPISLLTSFSKVIEKAIHNRLIDHLNNNNLLKPQQFGFRRNLSTENAIFNLTHEILKALNSKMIVGSIFFDLEEAFDSINHSLLLTKHPHYGISGKSKLLIKSYLTN